MHAIQSSPLVQAIGWTLLQSLWQIALVGIVLWLLLNFISKKSAQLSYAFSTSALLVVCVWTGLTFTNYWDFSFSKKEIATIETSVNSIPPTQLSPTEMITETAPIQIPSSTNIEASIFNLEMMLPFFVFAWLLGILFFGIKFTRSWLYLKELKKTKLPLPDIRWQNKINRFAQRMGIQKNVQFFLSEKINSPLTFGHFKPIILFPATMLTGLSDEQIEMLILHELAHIRRSDFLINLIQSILEVILFYHPVIWWISKQVRDSREHCCDDMAVAICKDRFLYAKTLTEIQSSIFSNKKSLAMSATGNQGSFTYRIQRLFQQRNYKSSYTKSVFSFGVLAICVMMFAFQQPFLQGEEEKNYNNEGMLFVIKADELKIQLKEVHTQLVKQNVEFEYTTSYTYEDDIDSTELNYIHGKIIMPDNSFFKFDIQRLEYLCISLDWSRRDPLMVTSECDGKQSSSTEVGDNGSLLARQPYASRSNPFFKSCMLDDVSVGSTGYKSSNRLFLNDLNYRQPLFILDGKKLSASEVEAMEIPTTNIFSIIKLTKEMAAQKYPSENINDWVYEITTQSNFQKQLPLNEAWKNGTTIFYKSEKFPIYEKSINYDETVFTVADSITVQSSNDGNKSVLHGGPVKITSDKPLDENFNPPLYFMNGIKLPILKGERLPIDVQNLEVMDSIIILTGKKATDIYGEEGKNGVWLIYATDQPLDIDIVNHQFSVDEKSNFEKSIQIHPNPVIDEAFISFEINGGQHLRLQIFDEQGKIVTTIVDGIGFAIANNPMVIGYVWRPKNIPSGIYYARIETGGEVFTKKIVKVNQ